jgi:predicted AAA+ superfamily ATPase
MNQLSGFPEPFFAGRGATYRRWSANYRQRLIREDVRDASNVQDIEQLASVFEVLPSRVGAPISFDSLARDVQAAPSSVKRWLELFDALYLTFRLPPWTKRVNRAITKEKKLYLFDYATIDEPGPRFENMVALELARAVNLWNDLGYGEMSLHYLRNKDKQEVDFLIADRQKPRLLMEAKLGDETPSDSLRKFQQILGVPAVQVVHTKNVLREWRNGSRPILTLSADRAFPALP